MRAVVQRVSYASIEVKSEAVASIGEGILALVGFHIEDTFKDIEYIANKVLQLRIFDDDNQLMNLSLIDKDGELLIASQFTLYGDARKGRRPSYSSAMAPDKAADFYIDFFNYCKSRYKKVSSGIFQSDMNISLTNPGPVTILLDSNKMF